MKVFVMGGTGSIGTAVTRMLAARGHQVTGLSRSAASDGKLHSLGAVPLRGCLGEPDGWRAAVRGADAVIQLAVAAGQDMGKTDSVAVAAVLQEARHRQEPLRFLYTGGCWLYGATGDGVADETRPLRPIAAYAWMAANGRAVLSAPGVSGAVIHPAMVYHEDGGVFSRFLACARAGRPIEVWGSIRTRWPLIHRDDLARAYLMLLERPELTGCFNAAAETGVPVQEIVAEIARRTGHGGSYLVRSLKQVLFEHGRWAEGPALDQQMSAERLARLCGWAPAHSRFQAAAF